LLEPQPWANIAGVVPLGCPGEVPQQQKKKNLSSQKQTPGTHPTHNTPKMDELDALLGDLGKGTLPQP
jgi:hypothetical protein